MSIVVENLLISIKVPKQFLIRPCNCFFFKDFSRLNSVPQMLSSIECDLHSGTVGGAVCIIQAGCRTTIQQKTALCKEGFDHSFETHGRS